MDLFAGAILSTASVVSMLLLWLAMDRALSQRRLEARLARLELIDVPGGPIAGSSNLLHTEALHRLGAALAAYWPGSQLARWRRALVQAGLFDRLSIEEFLALRIVAVVAGVLICASAVVLLGPIGLGFGVLGGLVGYVVPSLAVAHVAAQRRMAIDRLLPVTIDMLAVSLTAGLSFDGAVLFICERVDNELVRELKRYLADMHLGSGRREALEAMADRTQSAAVAQFVRAVTQADEMGTGMARTLSGQALALREIRRLHAEEQAGKATIALMFPLALCMLPAMFILILGPAVLQTMRMFHGR
jgi:tight adherence protein C